MKHISTGINIGVTLLIVASIVALIGVVPPASMVGVIVALYAIVVLLKLYLVRNVYEATYDTVKKLIDDSTHGDGEVMGFARWCTSLSIIASAVLGLILFYTFGVGATSTIIAFLALVDVVKSFIVKYIVHGACKNALLSMRNEKDFLNH